MRPEKCKGCVVDVGGDGNWQGAGIDVEGEVEGAGRAGEAKTALVGILTWTSGSDTGTEPLDHKGF